MIYNRLLFVFIGTVASLDLRKGPELSEIISSEPTATYIKRHPYMVALHVRSMYFGMFTADFFKCGGFIISEYYALTAAHCLMNIYVSEELFLRVGSTYSHKGGSIIPVSEYIPHPRYNTISHDNDVGVLKTIESFIFSNKVQPIQLISKRGTLEEGSKITASGWGQTNNDMAPERLQAVTVRVANYNTCYYNYGQTLTRNMFCAGDMANGGEDSCKGDSGGPAVQDQVAVGIISFGIGCALPSYPGIYTKISAPSVRNFIKKYTGI